MNPLLLTLTCPQVERCIETVLGRPVPRQASKAAALARLGREMRDRGLDAAEIMTAAGLLTPGPVEPEDDDLSYPGEDETSEPAPEEGVSAVAPEPVTDPLAGLAHLLSASAAFVADALASDPIPEPRQPKPARKATLARVAAETLNGRPLPATGTRVRTQLDLLLRPEGVTTAELHSALDLCGKAWGSAARGAREGAERYGLTIETLPGARYRLAAPPRSR